MVVYKFLWGGLTWKREQLFNGRKNLQVGRKPLYVHQSGRVKPTGCLVLKEGKMLVFVQGAAQALHVQVKIRIVIVDGAKGLFHCYPAAEFLVDLPLKSLPGAFPALYFTSWELPHMAHGTVAPLGSEYLGVPYYHCSHYAYNLHRLLFSMYEVGTAHLI